MRGGSHQTRLPPLLPSGDRAGCTQKRPEGALAEELATAAQDSSRPADGLSLVWIPEKNCVALRGQALPSLILNDSGSAFDSKRSMFHGGERRVSLRTVLLK